MQKNIWVEKVKLLEIDLSLSREEVKNLSAELNKEKYSIGIQTSLFNEQVVQTDLTYLKMQLDSEQAHAKKLTDSHQQTVQQLDRDLKEKDDKILKLNMEINEYKLEKSRQGTMPDPERDYKIHR